MQQKAKQEEAKEEEKKAEKKAEPENTTKHAKQPFDFQKVKVLIKQGKQGDQEILLDKQWTLEHIEHFRPVIEGVTDDEGIEITLTCNLEAFNFIIKYLQE